MAIFVAYVPNSIRKTWTGIGIFLFYMSGFIGNEVWNNWYEKRGNLFSMSLGTIVVDLIIATFMTISCTSDSADYASKIEISNNSIVAEGPKGTKEILVSELYKVFQTSAHVVTFYSPKVTSFFRLRGDSMSELRRELDSVGIQLRSRREYWRWRLPTLISFMAALILTASLFWISNKELICVLACLQIALIIFASYQDHKEYREISKASGWIAVALICCVGIGRVIYVFLKG